MAAIIKSVIANAASFTTASIGSLGIGNLSAGAVTVTGDVSANTLLIDELVPPAEPVDTGQVRIYYNVATQRLTLVNSGGMIQEFATVTDIGSTVFVSVIGSTIDTITVEWGGTISDIAYYELCYRPTNVSVPFTLCNTYSISDPRQDTVVGLDADSFYEFRIRGLTSTNAGGPYASTIGKTAPNLPIFSADAAYYNLSVDATVLEYGAIESVTMVQRVSSDNTSTVDLGPLEITDGVTNSTIGFGESIVFNGGKGIATARTPGGDMYTMLPASSAATVLHFSRNRGSSQVVAFYAFDACTVSLLTGNDQQVTQTDTTPATHVFATAGASTFTFTGFGSFKLVNDMGILLLGFVTSLTGTILTDQIPILPVGAKLVGIPSQDAYMTSLTDGNTANASRSDGTSDSFMLSKSSYTAIGPGSVTLYTGPSVVVNYTAGSGTITSVADANGTKATPWLVPELLGTRARILTTTDYAAFFSESAGTIDIWASGDDPDTDAPIVQLTLVGTLGAFKAYTNNPVHIPYGAFVRGSVPFGMICQIPSSQDEYVSFALSP